MTHTLHFHPLLSSSFIPIWDLKFKLARQQEQGGKAQCQPFKKSISQTLFYKQCLQPSLHFHTTLENNCILTTAQRKWKFASAVTKTYAKVLAASRNKMIIFPNKGENNIIPYGKLLGNVARSSEALKMASVARCLAPARPHS